MTSTFRDVPVCDVRAVGDGGSGRRADGEPVSDLASVGLGAAVPGDRPARQVNVVSEFAALWASRPARDVTKPQVAAWYEAKAELHELLAREADERGDIREQATEQEYAVAAHEHARALLIEATLAETTSPQGHDVTSSQGLAGGERR